MLWIFFAATAALCSPALTAENLKKHDENLQTWKNEQPALPSLTVSLTSAFEEVKSNRSVIVKSSSPGQEEMRPHLDSTESFAYEINYDREESELDLRSEMSEDYNTEWNLDSAFGEEFNRNLRNNIFCRQTTWLLRLVNVILMVWIAQVVFRILI